MTPTPIVAAAALSAAGVGWRGVGEAALVMTAGTVVKLLGMPAETPLANPRARKMMSRAAYLAARCLADLVADVTWARRASVGYFLGVGASGGSMDDVQALLDASMHDGDFSLARFGEAGLPACNPLLAFQLMNNFTLCHGAILEGIGGPNAALFSRGAGTVSALIEAMHAIADGDCDHAIAGGADSAVHPVTHGELEREGFVPRGMLPSEGAALLALGTGSTGARVLGVIEDARVVRGLADLPTPDADVVVLAPWGPPIAAELRAWAARVLPAARVADLSELLGDALAATPALAWCAAIDLLVAGLGTRVVVVSAGVDGELGVVTITSTLPSGALRGPAAPDLATARGDA
jgi:hypothetical protein